MCVWLLDQARINSFLQRTTKKKNAAHKTNDEEPKTVYVSGEAVTKEMEMIRRQVDTLMKKKKVRQVRGVLKAHYSFKPWGQEAQAKVCFITSTLLNAERVIIMVIFLLFF